MSLRETSRDAGTGTRFLIYPQAPFVPGYGTPEPVTIQTGSSVVLPGPQDRLIYVRDPVLDKEPYQYPYQPPFEGAIYPPVMPGPDGNFDNLAPSSRAFVAAHAFAAVSYVVDIWRSYLAQPIVWYFSNTFERLEIIPWLDWDNAQSGPGFVEFGIRRAPDGSDFPLALNFDVIAHEIGHTILLSVFGAPREWMRAADFLAFHEANADLVSLLSFLTFDSGAARLLQRCEGNLLTFNELNRIAELSNEGQIRLASNSRRLSEVSGEVHDRSRPFTGAVFDTIVDNFHWNLVQDGLADERLLNINIRDLDGPVLDRIQGAVSSEFRARPLLFRSALTRARDNVGRALAQAWKQLDAENLTFLGASRTVVAAADQRDGRLAAQFEENFNWRELI